MRLVTVARGWAQEVARAIVPVECPGCGAEDVRWCDTCESVWWDEPQRVESAAGRRDIEGRAPLPVWSAASLEGAAHGMIAAWKDSGRRDLDAFMTDVMARLATAVAPRIRDGIPALADVMVLPVPARAASTRARGVDLPRLLAREAARALRCTGVNATPDDVLVMGHGEARGASARQRWRGAKGAVSLKRRPAAGSAVVLVDDVVTTGASLAAAAEALERGGAAVVAGLTLASTDSYSGRATTGLV